MKIKLLSVTRLGVNALSLSTNCGPRLLINRRNEISMHDEKTLRYYARQMGLRAACCGIGRISIPPKAK